MSFRDLILGNPTGKTAWERFREGREEKFAAQEFGRAFNPLKLNFGDLVEVNQGVTRSFCCESLFWYRPLDGGPDYARYGLRDMLSGSVHILEVMPAGDGGYFYSLFEIIDELDWDEDLIEVIENEDILRHSQNDRDIDYDKDFVTSASVSLFVRGSNQSLGDVILANYLRLNEDGEQEYLCVELAEDLEAISFFLGKKIAQTDIRAFGSLN